MTAPASIYAITATPGGTAPLAEPPVIRADAIDPETGEFSSLMSDMDPVDAAVIEALWRVKGSGAAVSNVGAAFGVVKKIDDGATALISSLARNALQRLVNRGDIRILAVDTVSGADWAELTVSYHNLRTPLRRDKVVRRRL